MNILPFKMNRLKLPAFGLVILLFFTHQVLLAEEDMHAHHHHMAESKTIVRTVAEYKLPELKLVNTEAKEKLVSEIISTKNPVMLNFIFTTCTAICPVMSSSFAQVSKQLGEEYKDLQLISISVDPEQDTPAKLKEYATRFDGGSQWQLFTGSLANTIVLQKAFDSYRGDKMNHLPLTFMRGANSKKWVRLEGLASASELIKELHALPVR